MTKPAGFFWRQVLAVAATVVVAFGSMFYGFSVFLTEEAAGGEFSTSLLSLGYAGSVVAGGLLAFPVGRYADRHGVRGVFGVGAVLGALGLTAFALARQPWQVLAAWWLLVGPATAMTYYEPAFVAFDQWFSPAQRPRALATLTLIGGLAGSVFIPGSAALVRWLGWRPTAALLGALLAAVGGITALVVVPSAAFPDREAAALPPLRVRGLLREARFVLYTVALVLSFASMQAIIVHRVARFEEVGFAVVTVAAWAAAASFFSLPGRYLAPFVAQRLRPARVQAAAILVLAAAAVLMVDGSSSWQMVGHFAVFGVTFGALLPLRPMVMAVWYSGPSYGRVMGAQWTVVALSGAAGPAFVGVLHDASGGYRLPSVFLVVALTAGAWLVAASARR